MTVGVAAVAGRLGKRDDRGGPQAAIVLVADRRLTDSDEVAKIRGFLTGTRSSDGSPRSGWSALFAGEGSRVDDLKDRFLTPEAEALETRSHPPSQVEVAQHVRRAVLTEWRSGYDDYVYRQIGLRREEIISPKPPSSEIIQWVSDRGERFRQIVAGEVTGESFGCDLLVAGFDERERPCLFQIDANGHIEYDFREGYGCIGSGSSIAGSRLRDLGFDPRLRLGQVICLAIDAKIASEQVESVGPETDAWVMVPHREQPVEIDDRLIGDIRRIRAIQNVSPLGPCLRADDEPIPRPRPDWRSQLSSFVRWIYSRDDLSSTSFPSERGPRASRSRSGGRR